MPKVKRTRGRSPQSHYNLRGRSQKRSESTISLVNAGSASTALHGQARAEHGHQDVKRQSSRDSDGAMRLVTEFRRLCVTQVAAHPECKQNAVWMEKYMRNQFKFFGMKSPMRRSIQKDFIKSHREILRDRTTLLQLVPILWQQTERDFQYFGLDLLKEFRKEVLGSSEEDFRGAVSCVKQLITTKSWWDTVDALSYPVIGYFVAEKPEWGVPLMWEWIKHDNMWLRRTAILHQNCQKHRTDTERLFQLCLQTAHEEEFFIRKAIGWALRDYSWTNGKAVREFVEKNKDRLSSLSTKEALKHC